MIFTNICNKYLALTFMHAGLIFRDVEAHCSVNHSYHLSLAMAYIEGQDNDRRGLLAEIQSLKTRLAISEQRR